MAEIQSHKHCVVCGKAVNENQDFCDELCQSKYKSTQRRQQILFLAFLILMGLILLLPLLNLGGLIK
ncbi:MAG: DUF2116 family Zn-ribbon domain-containing protein [Methanotrichaceae archaeon]|nr:DUF2116 family Zn-ribbon domain-containing protein [Methanotrichaceae archaeon]